MDRVTGARRVIVAMTHTARGQARIVERCTLPVTSDRRVDLIVTGLAVMEPTAEGLALKELAPGVDVAAVQRVSGTRLITAGPVPVMALD
jgi:acetate CoA/acetoacetate CoA-transferase beta subunit